MLTREEFIRLAEKYRDTVFRLAYSWRKTVSAEEYAQSLVFEEPGDGEVFRQIMALDRKYRAVIVLA